MFSVTLLDINSGYSCVENLAIAYIAGFLRKNDINTNLVHLEDGESVDVLFPKIPNNNTFYGFQISYKNAPLIHQLSKRIKEEYPESKIFVGGRLVTYSARKILDDYQYIDFVVLGDGEYPVLSVMEAHKEGKDIAELESIVCRTTKTEKKPYIIDIKDQTWPARDFIPISKEKGIFSARLISARGCCGRCSFCSYNSYNRITKTKMWQGREIEDLYNEIISIYNDHGIRNFVFNDGSLEDPGTLGKKRLGQLCDIFEKHPMRFAFNCCFRAESFSEEELPLLKRLKNIGFTIAMLGIESGNDKDLKLYNKKATVADNDRGMELFRRSGIEVNVGFIMFNPFSDKQRLRENWEFLKRQMVYNISSYLNRLLIFYNTDIYHKIKDSELLRKNFSYDSPLAYDFEDPFVVKTLEFLNNTVRKSKIVVKENSVLFTFMQFYYNLKALFPDEIAGFEDELQSVYKAFNDELCSFFGAIYVDNDLQKAADLFKQHENNMNTLYQALEKMRFRIAMKKNIRQNVAELYNI